MKRLNQSVFGIIVLLLTACGTPSAVLPPATPGATWTPTATPMPVLTWTPTLTPTPTPIPSLAINVSWPEYVSALDPPFVIVDVLPPPGMTPAITVSAKVYDPTIKVHSTFELVPQAGQRYVSTKPLQLSLNAPAGRWWLMVQVDTALNVIGERMKVFEPAPVEFRALTDTLPAGVTLHVPLAFTEVMAQGNSYAGGRVWQHGKGEIALWWAPGPTEALLLNNAVVMLEATHNLAVPPEVVSSRETDWQGQPAFFFQEMWPGKEGGPSKVWVIQGANHWLYVLRIRAVGEETIPVLLQEVAATFAFQ